MALSPHTLVATLDRSSPIPLYHQLRGVLQRQIERGELRIGDRLPNEDFIAAHYEVSKITVREALKTLAAAGYVRREQGRGTFVTNPRVVQGPRKLTCFSDEMELRGLTASSRVLAAEVIPADLDLANKLAIHPRASVFRLKRIRLAMARSWACKQRILRSNEFLELPRSISGRHRSTRRSNRDTG